MASEIQCFEDEDVVLQGSELHAALTGLGFKDFECVPVQRNDYSDYGKKYNSVWSKISLPINERIYDTLCSSLLCPMQDNQYFDEQLRIILRLDCLLDDHVYKIKTFVSGKKECFFKKALHWLPFLGSSLTIAACGMNRKHKNVLNVVLASSLFTLTLHRKFLRWTTTKNLKRLIFLQNEIYISFKKSLKILRHSFRMRLDSTKPVQKFIELEKSKQMYLPPLTEILISSLENISLMYYRASKAILKLLPTSFSTDDLITAFETESFYLKGEVTYQSLKNLYYTYLLLQSEMLHLLGIAYNRETWKNSSGCPELKLSRIIYKFTTILEKVHSQILKLLNEYSSKKFMPEHKEFRGSKVSKWQDLYVHLDLTAYRLESAYKNIRSTLEEIDSHADVNSDDNFSEKIMQNLNEIYKQIDTARSFTEFSSLLVAKVQHEQSKEASFKERNPLPEELKPKVTLFNLEPQILDEVFEEYIKEEYIKPLYEDGDESVIQNYKFDKLLAKNFMSELKDALIEKHKSMSERESKALQRMYKNVKQEVSAKEGGENCSDIEKEIPLPPPLPFDISSSMNGDDGLRNNQKKILQPNLDILKSGDDKEEINLKNESEISKDFLHGQDVLHTLRKPTLYQNEGKDDDEKIDVQRFSIVECKPNLQFSALLKVSEETFVGSGENSEEEVVESGEDGES
ncbi:uncharacterized protein LOC117171961 [Belonocnema kinseyi]|uniref:uncharacterized protein LOC117171961 n=1 Tax=Belonocnema kinseyi TaxID=2817044 RepID=UPI00143CE658|nr:uncharacterized protein LOC117171961 [Belonocnema kinseyi]XP_033215541.1 uncharacterized protein LOC117171961 [Belonocnema kinseyi]XP_033215542.1 uncharacterized protein LOC117171961 [Belonocnema kinseyi]